MQIEKGKRYRRKVAVAFGWFEPIGELFVPDVVTKTTVKDCWGKTYTYKAFRDEYGLEPENLDEVKRKAKLSGELSRIPVTDSTEILEKCDLVEMEEAVRVFLKARRELNAVLEKYRG
jgi:hypothetical protein